MSLDTIVYVLAFFGAILVVNLTLSWYRKLYEFTSLGSYSFKPSLDSYAVITGASDGIGKEFAIQLSKKKYNLVLLARTREKLDQVARDCELNGVKAIVYPFDFSIRDQKEYIKLKQLLDTLRVEVLVNNVGVSHEMPVSFLDESAEMCDLIVNVNCFAAMDMTRIVLPQMVQRKQGLVINIGSMAGKVASPLLAVYGATKSFLKSWSRAIAHEVKKDNVHIEHINVFFVTTAMSKIRKATWQIPNPQTFVSSTLKSVGGSTTSTTFNVHAIYEWFYDHLTTEEYILNMVLDGHKDIRKRALAKKKRLEEEAARG